MTITTTLPSQQQGVPYKECITLAGTGPFSVGKHNLGDLGSVEIIGTQLCVTITSPKGAIDFAAEVSGSCSGCLPETIVASIPFIAAASCSCLPISFHDGRSLCIQANSNNTVRAVIELEGTADGLEFCGDALADCLGAKFVGNTIVITGTLKDPVFPIQFPLAIKNSCMCGCATIAVAIVDSNTFCLKQGWSK
jgi:hypothetical protein